MSGQQKLLHLNLPIRHQNPFGFRVRPLLRDRLLSIFRFEKHDVLIREFKLHRLIILNGLLGEVIRQYTPRLLSERYTGYHSQSKSFAISPPVRSMLAFQKDTTWGPSWKSTKWYEPAYTVSVGEQPMPKYNKFSRAVNILFHSR